MRFSLDLVYRTTKTVITIYSIHQYAGNDILLHLENVFFWFENITLCLQNIKFLFQNPIFLLDGTKTQSDAVGCNQKQSDTIGRNKVRLDTIGQQSRTIGRQSDATFFRNYTSISLTQTSQHSLSPIAESSQFIFTK